MRLYKYYIALLMTMLVACSEGGSLEENIPDNIPVELGAYASKYSDTRAGGILGNNDLASIAQNGGFGVYSYFMHTQEFMNNQQVLKKKIMMVVGACIFLVAAAQALPLFFGL